MYGQMMRRYEPRKVKASEGAWEGKGTKKRGRATGTIVALTGTPSWPFTHVGKPYSLFLGKRRLNGV